MKRNRYEQVCNEVEHGIEHTVEHDITHGHGKIVACRKDSFVIDAKDHTESWARQNCHSDD